jgi:hypothetical protein
MKVVCIENWGDDFTIGKIYEVDAMNIRNGKYTTSEVDDYSYMMIGDGGNPFFLSNIPKDKFITLDEWREIQLNKLV